MLRGRQGINEIPQRTFYYNYMLSRYSPLGDVVISEWRLAFFGLLFSLSVLTAKIFYANRYDLYNLFFEQRLVSYETIVTDGEVMLNYVWTTVVKYSSFWVSILCGALATWLTWIIVYLDSSVPGVQPPSPFSPSKYKQLSGHTFHLNYVFAVVVGLFVSFYMYTRGVTIQL